MRSRKSWSVTQSKWASNTVNPIRSIVENMNLEPNPDKDMIALSIGDPTVFGNLKPCEEAVQAVVESVTSLKYNGYAPSTGFLEAREAVADYVSCSGAEVLAKDIILASGCSQAIDLCISVLANPGQNIVVPRPGFALYRTLAQGVGVKIKYYKLLADRDWEADLEDLESQIDSQTVAIVVNNPSNPCGSVFSKEHLKGILEIASKNYVPIIADEIYDFFVFPGKEFHPIASLSTQVPILACGGLTKRYLVPGWRMGWVIIHDRGNVFDASIRKGLNSLSQRIMGSNTIVQGALPAILKRTPSTFFDQTIAVVKMNAEIAYQSIVTIPGLFPVMPSGAMYMMVGIDMKCFPEFDSDLEFVERLVSEQSLFCLPGMCFDVTDYFRIVLTVPEEQLREACLRLEEFCQIHYVSEDIPSRASSSDVLITTLISLSV